MLNLFTYCCSVIDIRSLTLIPEDKLGDCPPAADKGGDRRRGFFKGKKDGTKAGKDETDEDNDQPELPIVKDHATRGVSLCSSLFNVGYKTVSVVSGLQKARYHLILALWLFVWFWTVSSFLGLFSSSDSL